MFPSSLFYAVFTSKYFLSGHNSKKQLHISLSEAVLDIFSEAATRSLKTPNIHRSSHTLKKYLLHIFFHKQSHIFFKKQPPIP